MSASHDPQSEVQAVIDERVASGAETGVQVAVMHEGCVVVDAVAGPADPRTAEPVAPSTLFFAADAGFTSTHGNDLTEPAETGMRAFLAGERPPLGIHAFVPDFPVKAANLVRNLGEDRARLIQAVLTADAGRS